jgi:hypothetical protein
MAGLSQRAYARRRGVSHTAVRKALATGRITAAADGGIDAALADVQWSASTDLSKPLNSVTGVPKKRRAPGAASDPLGSPGWEDAANGASSEAGAPRLVSSYAASRAAREAYLARLAKLDFEQRSSKLVDADEVRAQIFALGRRMRDTLLGLPDRLAPVLAGQADPAAIHRILSEEILASLAELSAASPLKAVGRREGVQ